MSVTVRSQSIYSKNSFCQSGAEPSGRCRCCLTFGPHTFAQMKAGIASIFVVRGPVRRNPACPAQPSALSKLDRCNRARRNGEFDVPVEFVADVEKNGVCEG